ncbi:MAG: ribokinase [Rhodothalassiaceae bacterium]
MPGSVPEIAVIGSVNLDIVAHAPRLPVAGETVTGARLARYPGGKGANQALAARRLGARVALHAAVGADAAADEALALLAADGVDLGALVRNDREPTGTALIVVGETGENQIVVAPGANRHFRLDAGQLAGVDAVLCQLEIPAQVVAEAAREAPGLFAVNLAPVRDIDDLVLERADLLIVNEGEAEAYGARLRRAKGLVAITLGRAGARLYRDGEAIAVATPPRVEAIDSTGAGDMFSAALLIALLEQRPPEAALRFACAAAALSTTARGAQPSFPRRREVDSLLAH